MDVAETVKFLLAHQARMAAENGLFHAHQAEVRADHEPRYRQIELAPLETSEQIDQFAEIVQDCHKNLAEADKSSREDLIRRKAEQQELHRHMDERLNALSQIFDEIIRKCPTQ